MTGIGTAANVFAIIAGGLCGLIFKKGLKQRFRDIIMDSLGLCTLFIGLSGAVAGMVKLGSDGNLSSYNSSILIASLVAGSFIGEALKIEQRLESFGEWLKEKADSGNSDSQFVTGFITASLIVCVGAMAVIGPIEDGMNHDPSMLYAKSVLDGIIVMMLAATYGKGVIFSALPVGIFQGSITVIAALAGKSVPDDVAFVLSFVGSVLVFCVGANLCLGRKFRVANMLPALVICCLLKAYFNF